MQKKFLLIVFGALFLLADLVISLLFITGKSPMGLIGLSTPKITITPFPTMIVADKNILNNSSATQNYFPKTSLINKNPLIRHAAINSISNTGYKLAIVYADESMLPDPSFELVALVCNEERCDSARYDMSRSWVKEITFTKAMDFSKKKQITLVIKIRGDNKSSVNVYTEDSSKK